MIITKKYKLIICIFWLLCSVGLSGCRDHRSEMLLTGQAETENTKTPEETEAVDAEITKAAKEEEQAEPVETPTETAETLGKIFVDVCGAVVNPGVYEMEGDSRIFQAIEAAGGFLPEAATRLVNQAQPVSDGQQIYVPTQEEAEAGNYPMPEESTSTLGSPGDDTDENASDTVNINTADAAALKTLTGIGEAKARAILSYREEHGAFSTVEEIMQVPGIKESTFSAIKDKIAVK